MHTILIVTGDPARLEPFAHALGADRNIEVQWAGNGAEAIAAVKTHAPQAVVVDKDLDDMDALELVRRLLPINAMINTAVLSDLDPDTFHRISEGLGILSQLPLTPSGENAGDLTAALRRIGALPRPVLP